MKKIILTLAVALLALFALTGCSTPYKLTSYDEKGNVTSVAEGEKDMIEKITDATKDKLVLGWSNGWAGYIKAVMSEVSSGTVTPTGEIYAGKMAHGYFSVPNGFNATGIDIPAIIAATHENVSVGFTGASAASDNASSATSGSGTSVNGGSVNNGSAAAKTE